METSSALINQTLFILSLGTLLFLSLSRRLQAYWLTLPFLAMGWGILMGPAVFGLIGADSALQSKLFLREMARLTVTMALMAIAMRIPKKFWYQNRQFPIIILALGMPLMWGLASGMLILFTGYSVLLALLIGAILTPTDPVVSSPVVTGPVAHKTVPGWMRHGISSESGANDGLGLLFVLLPVTLLQYGTGGEGWWHWFLHALLKEIGLAVCIGLVFGWLAHWLFGIMKKTEHVRYAGYFSFMLIFPVTVMTFTRLFHADGILAAFLAGVLYKVGQHVPEESDEEDSHEVINKLVTVLFFVVVGLQLPFQEWTLLPAGVLLGLPAILVLRRVITILLLRRWLKPSMGWRQAAFLSWFAPLGAAAVYYVTISEHKLERTDLWAPVSYIITVSVLLHGFSATPMARWLGNGGEDLKSGVPRQDRT